MSGRKYPSGSMKRKRKTEKLFDADKKDTKNSVLDKYLVRVDEKNVTVCVGSAQILKSPDECKKIMNPDSDNSVPPIQTNDVKTNEKNATECVSSGIMESPDGREKSLKIVLDNSVLPMQTDGVESDLLQRTKDNTKNCDNGVVSNDFILTDYPGNCISKLSVELVTYDSDPALWPKTTERLRDFFVQNKPDQNINFLKNSGRMFGSKMRKCNESNFFRKKKNGELVERNWLIYSVSSNALFCYVCKLFSNSSDALCTSGLTDWQNLTKRLSSHEISKVHQQSVNCLSQLLCASKRVDSMLVKENESERVYWRNVLRRIVEVIKYISQRGLSFFGDNETLGSNQNGNFLGILELISTFDPFLEEHIRCHGNKGKGHVNYLSSSTVDNLIQIMSNRVLKKIVHEVHEAKYFGIIVDSTPDVTHVNQLSVVLRYVDSQNEPVERFLTFVPIHSHAAMHLYDTLTGLFKEHKIDLLYCRGQSYDNARNMSGKYSGLQTRIKSDNPLAEFVPCAGHSLNLVGVNAVESCQYAVSYFGFLQALYNFFSGSSHRWEILTTQLKKIGCFTLKCLSDTRWSANADAVKALRKGYTIVSDTLLEMSENENENAATKYEAKCLYKKIHTFEIALLTIIWDTLLQRINYTSKSIQSYTCNIEAIVPLYDSLESFINNIRGSFDSLEKEASTLVGEISYSKLRKRRIPNILNDSTSADIDFSEREKFIFQTHYVICDTLISNLNKRKKEYVLLQNRFGFLSDHTLSKPELCTTAKKFQEIYSEDIEEGFVDEFLQFSEFMPGVNNATEKLKMIKNLNIEHTYPNVEVALRIFLCIPISNCSGERSFSAMKRIKTRLRASMSSERLSGLALLTIENDLTKSLAFEDILSDFLNKSRKKHM